jgi:hypothetical protein
MCPVSQTSRYLQWNEQGVDLTLQFLEHNDLLWLGASGRMEDFLLPVVGETLKLLDEPLLDVLRVVAWADMPVTCSGIVALQTDSAALITRLVRSKLLLVREGTAAEGALSTTKVSGSRNGSFEQPSPRSCVVKNPSTLRNTTQENRETSGTRRSEQARGRSEKAHSCNSDMYVSEESDSAVVPMNQPNKEDLPSDERIRA